MLEISGKANDTIYKAKALRNIALNYLSIHDYNNASKYINQSIEILNSKKDENMLARALVVKAIILSQSGDHDEAIYYFNRALL
jgi:tetratricopeptide (TPR) repeat protein